MITLTEVKDIILNSAGKIIIALIIFVLTYIAAKIARKAVEKAFKKSSRIIKGDSTQYSFMKHFLSGLIYLIGISIAVYTFPSLRSLSVSLLAGAGVLAVIIGFASQQAFANIISGIFIAIFKPFRINDIVKIGTEDKGVVEDITLRHTVIRNFENKRVIIPNSVISNEKIENSSIGDPKICKYVEFGISYDSDIDRAMKIMREEAMKHPDFLDNRTEEQKKKKEPAVPVRVLGFGDSSVNLRAWVWAKNSGTAFRMGCDLNKSVKQRFDKEGIEIPFPYRTIVYKKGITKKPSKKRKGKS